MKRFWKNSVVFSLTCVMILGLMVTNSQKVSAAMIEDSIITKEPINFSNQSDDIFDGYDSMETTLTGRVGYNYA